MGIDILFRGATIYDGSGAPPRRGDVAVAGGRIVDAEAVSIGSATRRIDADGLALAPGFIDLHSHADCTLPTFPGASNSISQGVTTEVVGNCGYSPAPLSTIPERANELRLQAGGIGKDLRWDWTDFGSFLTRLDEARPAHNVVALVGHGSLRVAAMGMDDRAPTGAELAAMRADLADALAAGAWGMSTGLVYPPGTYAATEEIIAVGEALRPRDALYASHIRNEGDDLADAIDEALAIARALGTRVEISHLKSAGLRNHGRIDRALERIDAARADGLRATFDVYPYVAGSTMLTQALPPWLEDAGMERLIERLMRPEVRSRVRHELETGLPGFPNYAMSSGGWENIVIAAVANPTLAWAEGRSIAELATERGVDPLDLTFDLLVEDRAGTVMIIFMMAEPDVRKAIAHPAAGVGSDQLGVLSDSARVHPRCYGTFARLLAWATPGDGPLDLAETIRRMSGHAAGVLGLADRGRIAPGAIADLVAFDPARVRDAATYAEPTRLAEGIEYVLLGGSFALDRGSIVARDLGRVLRRPA